MRWVAAFSLSVLAAAQLLADDGSLPKIDMHMHANTLVHGPDGIPLSRPCNPMPCAGPAAESTTDEEVLQLTLEAMDRNNVVLGFLSGWPLNKVYRWVEAAPDRFIASPVIGNPGDIDLNALRSEYDAGRLSGLGELTITYQGIPPTDPKLESYYSLAEELDLPVLIHHQGTAGPSTQFRIAAGHPEQLEDVLIKHPKLRLYLENAGYPFLGETIALMWRYPNVYVDLSTGTWIYPRETFHAYLKGLIDAGLGKRIMFGSDQMQWPSAIDDAVLFIESATFLSDDQKRDIYYNNAARFLRLSDEEIAAHHDR